VSILEGLAMEDSGIFYCHLVNFPSIWYILGHFGIFCGHFLYFHRFGILYHEKSGSPDEKTVHDKYLRGK
jgi:hypothetical protein